jgi:hypothetical protein
MWNQLREQSDIDNLIDVFGRFHDSCLKEVVIRNREYVHPNLAMGFDNEPVVRFVFQRQFKNPSVIEMQFENVVDMNWLQDELYSDTGSSVIYEAGIQLANELIYWVEDIDWQLTSDDKNDYRWIAAKKAKWRIVESGLGKKDILIDLN